MLACSSTPWETDVDVVTELEWDAKERDKGYRYSLGRICPICGEPMTNRAKTCIDCLPLQMKNPILMAERQQRRLERLRKQLKIMSPQQSAAILATKVWIGTKRGAMRAKQQLLEEIAIELKSDPFALDRARKEREAKR